MSGSNETHSVASLLPARRWTFCLALQRMAEIVRKAGLRTLWFRILGETVYRRIMLLERSLLEPISEVKARLSVTIGRLDRTTSREYLEFRVGMPASELDRRFDAGHCCFVARYQGRIVSTSWAATEQAWMHYLSCEVPIAPGDVYIYDSFTRADFRSYGISQAVGVEMLRHFHRAGYRRAVRAISPENRANLHAVAKTGYLPYGVMGYVKVGPWRKSIYRTERGEGHT
jgi:GNAT superfamily N-acetyltransferase